MKRRHFVKTLMKIPILLCTVLATLLLVGCETTRGKPQTHLDSDGPQVVTLGFDPADIKRVANNMWQSIAASGVLNKFPDRPSTVLVSTVRNDTAQRIQVQNLTDQIMVSLNEAATMMIRPKIGPDGKPIYEDKDAAAKAQRMRFINDVKNATDADYTLSGYINETYARDGNKKQHTFTIQLRLANGEIVAWQGRDEFRKIDAAKTFGL